MNVAFNMYESFAGDDEDEQLLCQTCKGNGSSRKQRLDKQSGEIIYYWEFCEDCEGTGFEGASDYVD